MKLLLLLLVTDSHASYTWDNWPHEEERSKCGYVGLTNLGATCYMATCMQHLYMIPQARRSVLEAKVRARLFLGRGERGRGDRGRGGDRAGRGGWMGREILKICGKGERGKGKGKGGSEMGKERETLKGQAPRKGWGTVRETGQRLVSEWGETSCKVWLVPSL